MMATQSSPPPGWPLPTSPTAPLPPTSPPPSYSRHSMSNEIITPSYLVEIPRRRPLSTAPGNAIPLPQLPIVQEKEVPKHPNRQPNPTPVIVRKPSFEAGDDAFMGTQPAPVGSPSAAELEAAYEKRKSRRKSADAVIGEAVPLRPRIVTEGVAPAARPHSAFVTSSHGFSAPTSRNVSGSSFAPSAISEREAAPQPLQYFHHPFDADGRKSVDSNSSRTRLRQASAETAPPVPVHGRLTPGSPARLGVGLQRPHSTYSIGSGWDTPGRTLSPAASNVRTPSPSRHSPDNRPVSFIDLLNVPYPQPPPAPTSVEKAHLRSSVGEKATLLNTKKTLEMYRANAKKTADPTLQYEFAVFMVNAAAELAQEDFTADPDAAQTYRLDLLRESRQILQRLSDRSYPFAQYYLADGYASGLFNKGSPDDDRAFPLFVAASKHGHAEAGYRAALCYEFGWGCRKDPQKAVQFYRQSASKNHPGAMARLGRACLTGDMGLGNRYREGVKWMKRAAESADFQYNNAPYELGLLHEKGYGDDIFRDPVYAAQLFTQSADLGHGEANYRLGDAYEHGKLSCPRDPALSVHFYTGAAQQGHALAMMALCAWYMVGAEPVLDKDEAEAYEWARKAAETGLAKAQYAMGFFTEMGIGCRRDPLEANVWYVRAADQGDDRAKQRIAAIRAAAAGGGGFIAEGKSHGKGDKEGRSKKKWGLF